MLRGRFGDTSGRPYIEAKVFFPRLNTSGNVSFLMDTGADETLLMPLDAQRCSIDWDSLEKTSTSIGVGGHMEHFVEEAFVVFANTKELYVYSIDLGISSPSQEIMKIPSLLGRDIIDQWRITYDKPSMLLVAEVITASARIPLRSSENT